jgi:hypothetical protein
LATVAHIFLGVKKKLCYPRLRILEEKVMNTFAHFEEFWPHYVREHLHPTSRILHWIGTSSALLIALAMLANALREGTLAHAPYYVLAGLIVGYAFAWAGHLLFERNRPATFRHPLWSLRGDLRMWRLITLGRMDAEIASVRSGIAKKIHA